MQLFNGISHLSKNEKKEKIMAKTLRTLLLIAILFSTAAQCQKESSEMNYQHLMDSLSPDKYYPTQILNEKNKALYGTWKVIGTSGGIAGTGYTPDFNYLVLRNNGIFGIIRHDSLVTTGKISILNQTEDELRVEFVPETDPSIVKCEIVWDPEKFLVIHNDTLDINAPCCDRFNTRLKRVK